MSRLCLVHTRGLVAGTCPGDKVFVDLKVKELRHGWRILKKLDNFRKNDLKYRDIAPLTSPLLSFVCSLGYVVTGNAKSS